MKTFKSQLMRLTLSNAKSVLAAIVMHCGSSWLAAATPDLTQLAMVGTGGQTRDVQIAGHHAYVVDLQIGLSVFDVTNPSNPILVGGAFTGPMHGLHINGNLLFAASWQNGLMIFDISNPTTPTLVGNVDTPALARHVHVAGSYAFVADWEPEAGTVIAVDISNPSNPTIVSSYQTDGSVLDVQVHGDLAYVADADAGLVILDVTNPANPVLAGSFNTPSFAWRVQVIWNHAYVADRFSGLQIIDVSDPTNPVGVGSIDTPGEALDVEIFGQYAFVGDYTAGLHMVDVSNLATPTIVASVPTHAAVGLVFSDEILYLADEAGGFRIFEVNLPLSFSGFLPPIGGADATGGTFANPIRTFRLNSTIPVKFTVADESGPVQTGIHTLSAIHYSNPSTQGIIVDGVSSDNDTSGNYFRFVDDHWQFNLSPRQSGMHAGKWLLVATLADGSEHTAWINLR